VVENPNEGIDTIQNSVTFTLPANVENLTLTGTSSINATGNDLSNTLTGNSGANTLNGGLGADTMVGDAGNDTYIVDNASDIITENLNEGTDTVQSSITYTLGLNLENLTLTGTLAINGTGNELNNVITGNNASNILTGGLGNDTLNGGASADTLMGGLGNDTYVVDDPGDIVTEAFNEGTDTVQSYIPYTLGANVENLTLMGTSAINGTGNSLNNILGGNSAANVLAGGFGNDTYVIGAGDAVIENPGEGTDTIQTSITYTLG
jgi:Ca2+-binding RTX toxin-like protein